MTVLTTVLQRYFTDYAPRQRGLSPNTISAYRDTWRLLLKHAASAGVNPDRADFDTIDADMVTRFLDHLQTVRGNTTTTRNQRLAGIKAIVAFAQPDYPEHADTLSRILAIPTKRSPACQPVFLTPQETEHLIAAPDTTTWTGRRDRAMLTLAAQTGLRVSELASLAITDLRLDTSKTVNTIGKGRKTRATPLTASTVAVLRRYLAERATHPGIALFPGPKGQPLTRDAIERRLAIHLAATATTSPGIAAKHVTMHTLRHTAAMRLLEAGVDIAVIALWLGHEHTTTTDRYLHGHLGLKQEAIDRTRPSSVKPGRYKPAPNILAWLDQL
ncbi:MAG: site-specific integrase [Propionibacteriaceae bacterium]|nr:site-specific integrase [Propionibacteriaceae bacterium]